MRRKNSRHVNCKIRTAIVALIASVILLSVLYAFSPIGENRGGLTDRQLSSLCEEFAGEPEFLDPDGNITTIESGNTDEL